MKRFFLVCFLVFSLVLLASCGKTEEYEPYFQLSDGFSYENGVIFGTVYTLDTLHLRDLVDTEDDLLLTADFSADYYSEDGEIPLKEGENSMVLTFTSGELSAKIPVEIEVILLKALRVEMLSPEKTYHVGEHFDRKSIAVIGVKKDGGEVVIDEYVPEYEFSSVGEHTVGIDVGGFYESFSVLVSQEYRPTLDANGEADGVTYRILNGEATLVFAEGLEGFFAVPKTVLSDGVEYPVTEIGMAAFEGCAITSVQIPDGVLRIADSAFSDCSLLVFAEIPDSVVSLGKYAFLGCRALKTIALPDGITEVKSGTFRGCSALFRAELPSGLLLIGNEAFASCESLGSIEFPDTLREIGEGAFSCCKKLSAAVIASPDTLGARAFSDCEALSVFAIGAVKSVGEDVLDGSSPTVYGAADGAFSTVAVESGFAFVAVLEEPHLISLPTAFAIEDGYPYSELLGVYLDGDKMLRLKDYEITLPADACGYVDARLVKGDFTKEFRVFISYTETVAMDTDSRGAVYALDPVSMTATLVSLPQYVRRSEAYRPERAELFLVPTHLSRFDGVYTVVGVEEDAFAKVENMTEFFIPETDEK